MFWIIAVLLVLIALALVLPPLLRQQDTIQDASREQNIHIANEQLEELEKRFEQGEIDSEAYQASRDELEQSLYSDIKDEVVPSGSKSKSSVLGGLLIALIVPAIAIPVYLKVGNLPFTKVLDSKQAASKEIDSKVPRKADGTPDLDVMIAGLQKKMENNPNNVRGWTMLGRSYSVMNRFSDAAKAYEHALKLDPKSADLMLALADSLAMASNGEIVGRPIALITKALELEPNNQMALWLGGMASRQQGEYLTAIQRWKKVLAMTQNPTERKEINSLISEALAKLTPAQKEELGKGKATSVALNNDMKSNSKGITVRISLSDKFKAQASPTDLVFIYAKAMSGPPMPLAAVKKQVKDLPIEVVLNDQMAMMPSLKLSGFSEVIVGARISKSGQPIAQNGDLFSEKRSVKAGDKVSLEIDALVVK